MASADPDEAAAALAAVRRAHDSIAAEVGLPRGYWCVMGAAWVVLGALGEFAPAWAASAATLAFSIGHSVLASRLLDARNGVRGARISAEVAGRRTPYVVVSVLLALVAMTVAVALALDADGTDHPAFAAGVVVGLVTALGGPDLLRGARRVLGA